MKNIEITDAYYFPIGEKLNCISNIRDKVEDYIIKDYTNLFDNLFIIFQAYPKDFPAFKAKEYKIMRRKTKTLELYLILDYERIMQGTDPENLQHIKEVFLKGCETFLKPLKDFKWNEFEEQLKQII